AVGGKVVVLEDGHERAVERRGAADEELAKQATVGRAVDLDGQTGQGALGIVAAHPQGTAGPDGERTLVGEGGGGGQVAAALDGKAAQVGGEGGQGVGVVLVHDGAGAVEDDGGVVGGDGRVGELEPATDDVGTAGHGPAPEVGQRPVADAEG